MAGAPCQMLQHAQTSGVCPVDILQDHHERAILAQDIAEAHHVLEQAPLFSFGIELGIQLYFRIVTAQFRREHDELRQDRIRYFMTISSQGPAGDLSKGRIRSMRLSLAFSHQHLAS